MKLNNLKSGALLALILFSGHSFAEHMIHGLDGIKTMRGNAKGLYYVQLGSFVNKNKAYRFLRIQEKKWGKRVVLRRYRKYYSVGISRLHSAAEVRALVSRPARSRPAAIRPSHRVTPAKTPAPILSTSYSVSKEAPEHYLLPLTAGASGGYAHINGAYNQDGNTGLARFFLGLQLYQLRSMSLGIETGIQSGNSMRLAGNPLVIEEAGGLPVQASLKPMIDALLTVKGNFNSTLPLGYRLKAGVAYRQLRFENRNSARDTLNKINGELQAGLGYNLTPNLALTAMYQGVYASSRTKLQPDATGDLLLSHIPSQQAGLLGLEYSFK